MKRGKLCKLKSASVPNTTFSKQLLMLVICTQSAVCVTLIGALIGQIISEY